MALCFLLHTLEFFQTSLTRKDVSGGGVSSLKFFPLASLRRRMSRVAVAYVQGDVSGEFGC